MHAPRLLLLLGSAALAQPAAGAGLLFAGEAWAAFDRGDRCDAVARSVRGAAKGKAQPLAGFSFNRSGTNRTQFAVRLSRPARTGATVLLTVGNRPFLLVGRGEWAWSSGAAQDAAIMAAARSAGGMRVESRDGRGRRIVDRYLLAGAATAIDAAAAACANARLANRRINP